MCGGVPTTYESRQAYSVEGESGRRKKEKRSTEALLFVFCLVVVLRRLSFFYFSPPSMPWRRDAKVRKKKRPRSHIYITHPSYSRRAWFKTHRMLSVSNTCSIVQYLGRHPCSGWILGDTRAHGQTRGTSSLEGECGCKARRDWADESGREKKEKRERERLGQGQGRGGHG